MRDEHRRAIAKKSRYDSLTVSGYVAERGILAISVAIGLGVNALRREGLPLIADGSSAGKGIMLQYNLPTNVSP